MTHNVAWEKSWSVDRSQKEDAVQNLLAENIQTDIVFCVVQESQSVEIHFDTVVQFLSDIPHPLVPNDVLDSVPSFH